MEVLTILQNVIAFTPDRREKPRAAMGALTCQRRCESAHILRPEQEGRGRREANHKSGISGCARMRGGLSDSHRIPGG